MLIKGVIVPLLTPLKNENIDEDSLERLINYVIDGGVDVIFILGTNGEFQYLSLNEKKKLITKTLEYTKERVPILVGIGSKDQNEILSLVEFSQNYDISGFVLPLTNKTVNDKSLKLILDKVNLPTYLYSNPQLNKKNLDIEFIKQAKKFKQISGIKDSSGDWNYFLQLLSLKSDSFSIYQGRTDKIIESLNNEAKGIVNGYANIYPKLIKDLYLEKSEEIFLKILEVKKELKQLSNNNIKAMKTKLVEKGILNSPDTRTN